MRTADDFVDELTRVMKHPQVGYGGNVLPAAKIYSNIVMREEIAAYADALERMLASNDQDIRRFAITLCLGFFTFYDAIPRPKLRES